MKLRLFIAPEEKEKYLAIHAPKFDEDIQQIISHIENLDKLTQIYGKLDNEIYVLEVKTITSFRTHKNQVIALKDGQQFKLKDRLY